MSRKSRVELGDTSSGSVLGLVPLEIRVDKVDEPLNQAQKSVYVSITSIHSTVQQRPDVTIPHSVRLPTIVPKVKNMPLRHY